MHCGLELLSTYHHKGWQKNIQIGHFDHLVLKIILDVIVIILIISIYAQSMIQFEHELPLDIRRIQHGIYILIPKQEYDKYQNRSI